MTRRWCLLFLFSLAVAAGSAQAHEIRPGYLELHQLDNDAWDVLWKVPVANGSELPVRVRLPPDCHDGAGSTHAVDGAALMRWRSRCTGGLVDRAVAVEGLSLLRTDVLVRVKLLSGGEQTVRLTPAQAAFVVQGDQHWHDVGISYLGLGVEHILLGVDHLLFVLALMFLVDSGRRLLITVSAFTVGHSMTLIAAAVGGLQLNTAAVEALIALSIAVVGVEIIHRRRGRPGMGARWPATFAGCFGLLHGLGFAAALRELGLPEQAIPLALLSFNVGVELGQLAFIAVVIGVLAMAGALTTRRAEGAAWHVPGITVPVAYLIGSAAMFWVFERTSALWL